MIGLKERVAQEKMEKDLSELFERLKGRPEYVTALMKPDFVSCDAKEGNLTVEFPVQKWQLNPHQTMHGGLIASAFDETFGIFAFYLNGEGSLVTVNISLNYQKPIPLNDSILITARTASIGKRLITLTGECRLKSSGSLTNTAQMTFAVL
jgi:uncharacterized protein (TIGR00369 family)